MVKRHLQGYNKYSKCWRSNYYYYYKCCFFNWNWEARVTTTSARDSTAAAASARDAGDSIAAAVSAGNSNSKDVGQEKEQTLEDLRTYNNNLFYVIHIHLVLIILEL